MAKVAGTVMYVKDNAKVQYWPVEDSVYNGSYYKGPFTTDVFIDLCFHKPKL